MREGKRRVIAPSNAVWDDFLTAPASAFPHKSEPMGSLYPKKYTGLGLGLDKHSRVFYAAEFQTGVDNRSVVTANPFTRSL